MSKTLCEQIKQVREEFGDRQIVVLYTKRYGDFWIGQARFVWQHVNNEAWNGTNVLVRISK